MHLPEIILFGFAVSMDGFATGVAYGIRRVRIPFLSLLLICFSSSAAVAAAMFLGAYIAAFLSRDFAVLLGGALLIFLGALMFFKELKESVPEPVYLEKQNTNYSYLGFLLAILKDPYLADADDSGAISIAEAAALGIALAMDAFGAGLGLAMTGINPLLTAVTVALTKFFLVTLGLYLGQCINGKSKSFGLLAGILLIILGVINLS